MASAVRQNVVAPLGLMTTPNPYGQYPPGSLSQADGVSMRAPGELRTLPSILNVTFTGNANGDRLWKMMPIDAGHIYSFTTDSAGTAWGVFEGIINATPSAATLPSGLVSVNGLFTKGRVCPVRSRERMLVNSTAGEMVCDVMAPGSSNDRALRFAGMPQPIIRIFHQSFTDGPLPPLTMVAYRCVVVREFADGYSIKSVPSPALSLWPGSSTTNNSQVGIDVLWDSNSILAGDILEVYRTDGLNTNTSQADPGPTFKLIIRYTMTSTDISNGIVHLFDNAACAAPFYTTAGRELYTNPGQEGELGANRQPDVCGATAVFKGYTFYGNLTERPQLQISVPAGFMTTDATVTTSPFLLTNHIGGRSGAGTITAGSPTITAIPSGQNAGVVPGQIWNGFITHFPFGTKVLSVTSTTITFAVNATNSSTTDGWSVMDVIQINGVEYRIGFYGDLATLTSGFELTYSATANQTSNVFNSGDSIVVEPIRYAYSNTLTVRATNGANYSPPFPEINQAVKTITATTTPNLMRWSKNSEPEHVPAANEDRVGSSKIISFVSTKDAMWIFCTDGVFRLSGDAGVWRVDVIDPKCILCAPQCATSLHETVYAYTNYGFVSITASGIKPISLNRVTELLPGSPFAELGDMIVDRDPTNHEVLISLDSTSSILYIYNTPNDAFTRIANDTNFATISAVSFQDSPVSGSAVVVLGAYNGSGSKPVLFTWNSPTNWTSMSVAYRPVYGNDPASQKQWISVTAIFNASDSGKQLGANISNEASGSVTLRQSFNDSYATTGVLRKYAIAPSVAPGFVIAGQATQTAFRGVSLYLVEHTQQPWRQK